MFKKDTVSAVVAEFFGTSILAFVLLNIFYKRLGVSLFEAIAVGVTFIVLRMVLNGKATGYYNPAVTVALWTMKQLKTGMTLAFLAAQALAGVVVWTLGGYLLDTEITNIANTETDWRIFAAEALGAALLGYAIVVIHKRAVSQSQQAAVLGGAYAVAIMLASLAGNGVINPAAALGIQSISFAYVAGPILGAIVGVNLLSVGDMTLSAAGVSKKKTSTRKKTTKRKK